MSEVTNEHILRELRLLRDEVKTIDTKIDLVATAVSNHADRLFDFEVRLTELERHASNGSAE